MTLTICTVCRLHVSPAGHFCGGAPVVPSLPVEERGAQRGGGRAGRADMTPETCVLCHGAIAPSDDTRLMSGVAHQQCPRRSSRRCPLKNAALAEEFVVAANRLEHEGREWLQMDAPQLRAIAHRVRSIPALTREQARCLWLETRDTDDHGFPTMELWHWWHDENEDGVRERDRALAVLKRIAEGTP